MLYKSITVECIRTKKEYEHDRIIHENCQKL